MNLWGILGLPIETLFFSGQRKSADLRRDAGVSAEEERRTQGRGTGNENSVWWSWEVWKWNLCCENTKTLHVVSLLHNTTEAKPSLCLYYSVCFPVSIGRKTDSWWTPWSRSCSNKVRCPPWGLMTTPMLYCSTGVRWENSTEPSGSA